MVKAGMFISDRYEIISKIGAGGMADVYKAKDHRLNRNVAIKILKQEFSEDKKFVDKFRGEAQSAAGLSHPNIVNVYDVGEDDELHYIVMELVEGITLKNFIERKGKLEVKEAIGIAIQIAQGMNAAHMNHIIHRDIKPQNIIISREGKVKVTDFGIAKATTSNTITSNAMGSVYYISPEQARGGYSDEKSDIYSLGITLYEMLTGQVPFAGDNTVSVALAHIQEDAPTVRTLNSQVPASLDRIVQKCMQKKPERRYLNAETLIADLKKSIIEPDGDFVKLVPTLVDDSPTIQISQRDVNTIRNEAEKIKKNESIEATGEIPELDKFGKMDDDPDIGEEKDIDPKLEKLMIGGGIAAAVILVIIIIVLIAKAFGLFGGSSNKEEEVTPTPTVEATATPEPEEEGIDVPYVVGWGKDVAEEELKKKGFDVKYEESPSDSYAEGVICAQDPKQGEKLEKGETVTLTVSTGSESTKVPNVAGKTRAEADAAIVANGLAVGSHEEEFSDSVAEGKVIRTSPAAGAEVSKNSSVTVYISKGKEIKDTTVPDLSGCTESEALKKLKEAGLTGSVESYDYNDKVEKGKVISQSHNYGVRVEEGTKITFHISLGPEEVNYRYTGSITISDNPFLYQDEDPAKVVLKLTQDGKIKTIYSEELDFYDFPLSVDVEGSSESSGKISMYVDGSLLGTYTITFKKEKQ
ncbi:Stk1 family PASTA domain-containing Ser/Thr kinase [Velocimicrobium porci]|uniref:non-specific serine/threonine protein kinase n=1 Tax=Velocimicrobium porci TaxID=2606634 RepID=A0A6L5XWX3_9FIRM|nr:Stk1 family PASTA domain-containing Ser/Thr kinase [Velocimicrobium porci]MSS63047.1 Stk1 family PASTA domain-containing Ser/Thr kinase [Velocimicrobium porci]